MSVNIVQFLGAAGVRSSRYSCGHSVLNQCTQFSVSISSGRRRATALAADEFVLDRPDGGLGQSLIEDVADRADGGVDAGVDEWGRERNRRVLGELKWSSQHLDLEAERWSTLLSRHSIEPDRNYWRNNKRKPGRCPLQGARPGRHAYSAIDGMTFDAVRVRVVEIGEAVKHLDANLIVLEPGLP